MAQANPSAATYILLGEAYMRIQMPEVTALTACDCRGVIQLWGGVMQTVPVVFAEEILSLHSFVAQTPKRRARPDVPRINRESKVPAKCSSKTLAIPGLSLFFIRWNRQTYSPMHKPQLCSTQAAIESFEIALDTDPSDSALAGQVGLWHRPNTRNMMATQPAPMKLRSYPFTMIGRT